MVRNGSCVSPWEDKYHIHLPDEAEYNYDDAADLLQGASMIPNDGHEQVGLDTLTVLSDLSSRITRQDTMQEQNTAYFGLTIRATYVVYSSARRITT